MNSEIKKVAIMAAKKAGKELFSRFDKFSRDNIKLKSGHEILTKADLAAEKEIIKVIKKNFPKHQVLSEEGGGRKKKSDYLWIVDPLDGTTNFSMHNPLWAVSIAIAHKKKIILGVIFSPYLNELYTAEINKGAYMNGKKIKVSDISKGKVLNTFCHGNREKDIKRAIKYYTYQKIHGFDCRQMGSASLELAFTASGRTESIVIPGAHPWDVAAGILLVREAGGRVTDFSGKKWSLKSNDIAVSNGKIHKKLLAVLKKI